MNFTPWILAARPKTLTASIVPIVIASSAAYANYGVFSLSIFFFSILTALFIQVGTNFINDAIDCKRGADTTRRLGPARAVQQGLLLFEDVHYAGMCCLFGAILCGIPLMLKGGPLIGLTVGVSSLAGYSYTGGPFPLAYKGLGDLGVFLFYGLAFTGSVYYLQASAFDASGMAAAIQVGLFATSLIAINNARDQKEDAKCGKKTAAVLFGTLFAKVEVAICLIAPFIIQFYWIAHHPGIGPYLPYLALPTAMRALFSVLKEPPGRIYNTALAHSSLAFLQFGALFFIGQIL